jgi:hypothetical protein
MDHIEVVQTDGTLNFEDGVVAIAFTVLSLQLLSHSVWQDVLVLQQCTIYMHRLVVFVWCVEFSGVFPTAGGIRWGRHPCSGRE